MDTPIYIYRASFDDGSVEAVRNKLYVIEGRDGSAGEEVAKTDTDRIGVYNLPDLHDLFLNCGFFVAGSRLFNVCGGISFRRGGYDSFIQYVDYSHPNGRWEWATLGGFIYLDGMGVLDGDRIHYFGRSNQVFSFHANDLNPRISAFYPCPAAAAWRPISLAVTPGTTEKQKIYVFWDYGGPNGMLGFYLGGEWHPIDDLAIWPLRSTSAVVVKDQFLITFSDYHPLDETERYAPELYVCDIRGNKSKWLDKPVEGFLQDDSGLPIFHPGSRFDDTSFLHTSVMQVSEVNFAVLWSTSNPQPGQKPPYELNCTKFRVSIQDEDKNPPTIRAQLLSSIGCSALDITFKVSTVHSSSTIGNPSSGQETPSRNQPLKRKLQDLQSQVSSSEG